MKYAARARRHLISGDHPSPATALHSYPFILRHVVVIETATPVCWTESRTPRRFERDAVIVHTDTIPSSLIFHRSHTEAREWTFML
jgi:hypothetical protein